MVTDRFGGGGGGADKQAIVLQVSDIVCGLRLTHIEVAVPEHSPQRAGLE